MMVLPFTGTLALTAGLVPVAINTFAAASSLRPLPFSTCTRCAPRKLRLNYSHFILDYPLYAVIQIRHRHDFFHPIVRAVKILIIESGKVQHRFAHGFTGDGASIDTHAADRFALFNHCHSLAGFCRLDGGALPARSGANHNQVIRLHLGSPVRPIRRWGLRGRRCLPGQNRPASAVCCAPSPRACRMVKPPAAPLASNVPSPKSRGRCAQRVYGKIFRPHPAVAPHAYRPNRPAEFLLLSAAATLRPSAETKLPRARKDFAASSPRCPDKFPDRPHFQNKKCGYAPEIVPQYSAREFCCSLRAGPA